MSVFRGTYFKEGTLITLVGMLGDQQVGGQHVEQVLSEMLAQVPQGRQFILTLAVHTGPAEQPSTANQLSTSCPQF
jgi:hypothetical protein